MRGDAFPLDRYSRIERAWAGRTVCILAGGWSLTPQAVEKVRSSRERDDVQVIAINDSYRLAPCADVLYFADARWWEWHRNKPEFQAFAGEKVSIQNTGALVPEAEAHILRVAETSEPLSADPRALRTCRNGGYQCINFAVLAGAARIALLGMDMKPAPDGRMHWFGDHPVRTPAREFDVCVPYFRDAAKALAALGVDVVNCSPDSAIDAFRKASLESVLPDSRAAVVPA